MQGIQCVLRGFNTNLKTEAQVPFLKISVNYMSLNFFFFFEYKHLLFLLFKKNKT